MHRLPVDIAELNLTAEKTPRQDVVFVKKTGSLFHWHLHETLQMSNNKVDNFETVYTTMALLFLELGADEVIVDLFRLALEIQVCHCLEIQVCQYLEIQACQCLEIQVCHCLEIQVFQAARCSTAVMRSTGSCHTPVQSVVIVYR